MMYEWLTGTLNGVDYIILKSYRKPVLNAIKIVFDVLHLILIAGQSQSNGCVFLEHQAQLLHHSGMMMVPQDRELSLVTPCEHCSKVMYRVGCDKCVFCCLFLP